MSKCNLSFNKLNLIDKINSVIRYAEKNDVFVEFYVYKSVYYRMDLDGCFQPHNESEDKGIGLTIVKNGQEFIYSFDDWNFEQIEKICGKKIGFKKNNYFIGDVLVKDYGYKKDYFSTKQYKNKIKKFWADNQNDKVDFVISCQFEKILIANNKSFSYDGRLFQKLFVSKKGIVVQTFSSANRTFVGDKYNQYSEYKGPILKLEECKFNRILFLPSASGVLFHEICGHMLENDYFVEGNPLFNSIGKKVCNSDISIYDNPNRMYGNKKHTDDEGNVLCKTPLITGGKLVGLLGCRCVQNTMDELSFASKARRESYKYAPTGRSFCIEVHSSKSNKLDLSEMEDVLIVKGFSTSYYNSSNKKIKCETSEVYILNKNRQMVKLDGKVVICISGQEFLKNIIAMYDDYYYQEDMCLSSSGHVSAATYTPSVLFDNVSAQIKVI